MLSINAIVLPDTVIADVAYAPVEVHMGCGRAYRVHLRREDAKLMATMTLSRSGRPNAKWQRVITLPQHIAQAARYAFARNI